MFSVISCIYYLQIIRQLYLYELSIYLYITYEIGHCMELSVVYRNFATFAVTGDIVCFKAYGHTYCSHWIGTFQSYIKLCYVLHLHIHLHIALPNCLPIAQILIPFCFYSYFYIGHNVNLSSCHNHTCMCFFTYLNE